MKVSIVLTGILFLVLSSIALPDETAPIPLQDQPAQCCYENPNYSGQCEVTPGEGETCASILGYLNTPNSAGKTYCNSTDIRGGWKQAKCASQDTQESDSNSSK